MDEPIFLTQSVFDLLLSCNPRTKEWAETALANGNIQIYEPYIPPKETFKEKLVRWLTNGN